MGIKVSVEKLGDVWVISDSGMIAGALTNIPVPLGFVADHESHIGSKVALMEAVLSTFCAQQLNLLTKNKPEPVPTNGNGSSKGRIRSEDLKATGDVEIAKAKSITLEDLGLKNQQLWRLKSAKITTVAKLGMLTEEKLGAKKGIGLAIVKAVKKGLKKHGLRLTAPVG